LTLSAEDTRMSHS